MRFLVTGSNGLVGSRVCTLLEQRGHQVVGLGRGPRRAGDTYRYVPCDLTREQDVTTAITAAAPEAIIHCASMTEVDLCEREPELAYSINVTGTAVVARGAKAVGAHLVHVSTDYVFDGDAGPYDEQALPNPRGVYALTKHMAEQTARVFVPGATIARTAVVYGWPAAGRNNFGTWLVGTLSQGQTVKLFEDQIISPSYAGSVAEMLVELGERKLGGIWNTCGGEVVDRVTFGRALCELFGFDPKLIIPVKMAELKLPGPRPLRSGLRVDKVKMNLRARPLGLHESLARFQAEWKGRM